MCSFHLLYFAVLPAVSPSDGGAAGFLHSGHERLPEMPEFRGESMRLFYTLNAIRYTPSYLRHLMLHPMLGRWSLDTGLPATRASMAARRSWPVTGVPLPGRLESSWPR